MITPGTILIERDTLRPEFFDVMEGSYPNSFMSLTPPSASTGRRWLIPR